MIIYCIRNILNNKRYIGQTIQSLKGRLKCHRHALSCFARGIRLYQSHFYSSLLKYGWDNFEITELCSCSTQEELNMMEIFYISKYHTADKNFGYNIELGGNGRGKVSEETKRKMSISKIGNKYALGRIRPQSERDQISKSNKGKNLGERSSLAKLTMELANKIREEYKEGNITQAALAAKYNLGHTIISDIILNKRWINKS